MCCFWFHTPCRAHQPSSWSRLHLAWQSWTAALGCLRQSEPRKERRGKICHRHRAVYDPAEETWREEMIAHVQNTVVSFFKSENFNKSVPAAGSDVWGVCWVECSRTAAPRCTESPWGRRREHIRPCQCTGKPSPAAVCRLRSGSAQGSTKPCRTESDLQGAAEGSVYFRELEWLGSYNIVKYSKQNLIVLLHNENMFLYIIVTEKYE